MGPHTLTGYADVWSALSWISRTCRRCTGSGAGPFVEFGEERGFDALDFGVGIGELIEDPALGVVGDAHVFPFARKRRRMLLCFTLPVRPGAKTAGSACHLDKAEAPDVYSM